MEGIRRRDNWRVFDGRHADFGLGSSTVRRLAAVTDAVPRQTAGAGARPGHVVGTLPGRPAVTVAGAGRRPAQLRHTPSLRMTRKRGVRAAGEREKNFEHPYDMNYAR